MESLRLGKTCKSLSPTINQPLPGLTEINPVLVKFQLNSLLSASKFKIKFHGHSSFYLLEYRKKGYCTQLAVCINKAKGYKSEVQVR